MFKVGIEVEFTGASRTNVASIANDRNLNVQTERYTHRVTNHWKLVSDCSLGSREQSGELVSPVLVWNDQAKEEVRKVLKVLQDVGASVNRSCGLHIHLSWDEMATYQVKHLVKRFTKYERAFDLMMPESRRSSRWCREMSDDVVNPIINASDNISLSRLGSSSRTRYVKLNTNSLSRYTTVEFRQHSGTIEHEKIIKWIDLLISFTKASNTEAFDIHKHNLSDTKFKASKSKLFDLVRKVSESTLIGFTKQGRKFRFGDTNDNLFSTEDVRAWFAYRDPDSDTIVIDDNVITQFCNPRSRASKSLRVQKLNTKFQFLFDIAKRVHAFDNFFTGFSSQDIEWFKTRARTFGASDQDIADATNTNN